MFDFVSGYICGMVITFWLLCFFMGANRKGWKEVEE